MSQSHTQSHDVFDVVKAHGGLRGENGVRKEVLWDGRMDKVKEKKQDATRWREDSCTIHWTTDNDISQVFL